METNDLFVVATAVSLTACAGLLQYSLSSGDKGINSFLMKEKGSNPFYSSNFRAEKPKPPRWLDAVQLPSLDFVETFNSSPQAQPPQRDDVELTRLYQLLDAAVECAAVSVPFESGSTALPNRGSCSSGGEANVSCRREDYAAAQEVKASIDARREAGRL